MNSFDKTTIQRFLTSGPRYTSYPTTPEWKPLQDDAYIEALSKLNSNDPISVYIHIPFCEKLCFYCGCNIEIKKSVSTTGDTYINYLKKECQLLFQYLKKPHPIQQLHIGGGTPNYLQANQLYTLMAIIKDYFTILPTTELSIELDPRVITDEQIKGIKDIGFNRLSMGIQDFNPLVQKAINRIQPFSMVEELMIKLRDYNFPSINMDLIYGLPYQTEDTIQRSTEQVISLEPDRIAFYSYAHLPKKIQHQKLIPEQTLAEGDKKLNLFLMAKKLLTNNNYIAIAMDHFAKEKDSLAKAFETNTLYRNFMGYTLKPTKHFIGIGTSAISFINYGFFQNIRKSEPYYDTIDNQKLPISRGILLNPDDIKRQWVIQSLMCHFHIDKELFLEKFHVPFNRYFIHEQSKIQQLVSMQLIKDSEKTLEVLPKGKLFVRNICMTFDAYLKNNQHIYSKTI